MPLAQAAAAAFGTLRLSADEARLVSHGVSIRAPAAVTDERVAAFGPDGNLIALLVSQDGELRPLAVFVP